MLKHTTSYETRKTEVIKLKVLAYDHKYVVLANSPSPLPRVLVYAHVFVGERSKASGTLSLENRAYLFLFHPRYLQVHDP